MTDNRILLSKEELQELVEIRIAVDSVQRMLDAPTQAGDIDVTDAASVLQPIARWLGDFVDKVYKRAGSWDVLDNIRETETTSTALPILPHGSLKTFALKAPSSTERLMMLVAGDTVFKLKKNGDGNSSKRPAAVSESENHRGEFCANSLAGQAAREQKVGKFMAELLHWSEHEITRSPQRR